jgi:hypothetical protein
LYESKTMYLSTGIVVTTFPYTALQPPPLETPVAAALLPKIKTEGRKRRRK